MEPSHYASDLDPSSVLGFGSALAMLDAADEVGRLLTGALRSMGLADVQAVVLNEAFEEGGTVVGSVGTSPLPEEVVGELRRIEEQVELGAAAGGGHVSRRQIDVDDGTYPALAAQGVRRLSVLRLGTIDAEYGLVAAGHADPEHRTPIEGSSLQMMAAQVSMALHRIQLDRERQIKAEALRASEARYRELYENAPVAYLSVDEEGRIHMANQRAAELLRTTEAELCGNGITGFCVDTAEATETIQHLTECIRGRKRLFDEEVQICRTDGEQIWVSMSVQPIDPPDGPPECLVMMVDITERVHMETALRDTRDELEERVEARTEALQEANEQLRRQTRRLEALKDIDRAILAAESPREIATVAARQARELVSCERVSVALFDRDADRVTVLTAQQNDTAGLEGGTTFPLDEFFDLSGALQAGAIVDAPDLETESSAVTRRLRDAGLRSAITVPMLVEGDLIGAVNMGETETGAFGDVERRIGRQLADRIAIALRQSRLLETVREKREQLAALRDIDQGILAAESPEEIAQVVLRRAQHVIPFESASVAATDWEAEEVRVLATSDKNLLDAPRTLPIDDVYLSDRVCEGRTEVASVEDYAPVPEAQARMREMGLASILCLPMVVEDEVVGVVHVGRTEPDAFTEADETVGRELADHMAIALRQAQLLEAVQKRQEHLEERVQERTAELESFTYSVSHDLRTPLRAIDGYARILKEDHADQLDDEGRRLLNVIYDSAQTMGDQIDDLLTLSRVGRREMNRVSVDVEALAREAFEDLCRARPEAEEVAFEVQALPAAHADRSMLRHVFTNLLSNALKFTRQEEQPCIEVGGRTQDGTDVYFVRDNGVGFDPDRADDMFDVFERLHEDVDGTGVGLALVERVIRRHKGEVWAEGAEGEGATVFFALPRPDRA